MRSLSKVLGTLAKGGLDHVLLSSEDIGDESLNIVIAAMDASPIPVQRIDLSANNITSVGAVALAQFLCCHPYVQEVQLQGNKIGDEGAKAFIEVFRGTKYPRVFNIGENPCSKSLVHRLALLSQGDVFSPDIRRGLITGMADELDLTGMDYNKVDSRLISIFIEGVEGLKSLKLSGCSLGDAGAGLIGDLAKESSLTHIDMSNNGISDVGVSLFIDHSNLYHHPTITWLSFANNIRIGNGTPQRLPSALFDTNEKITCIDFSETSCTSSARGLVDYECELNKQPTLLKRVVVQLRKNDPSCTIINLQWEDGMNEAARFIAPVLKLNTYLLELNLGNCSLGDRGAEFLANNLRNQQTIRVLGLANNGISASGAKALFQCFQRHLTLEEVNLANNNITDEAAPIILTTVRLNNLLKVVNLVNNFLAFEYMNEIEGFTLINQSPKEIRKLLTEIEANNAALTTLKLHDPSGENFYNDASVRLLCQALLLNKTVTSLDLSKNVVGDVGVGFIAGMLMTNSTITELNLAENSITSRGAKRLCNALRTNASLKRLNISGNAINNTGMEGFLEMLKFNCILLEVIMDNTSVSTDMRTKVTEAADLNKEPPELKAVVYKLLDGDRSITKVDLRRERCSRALDDQSIQTLSIHLAGKSWVECLILKGNSIGHNGCKGLGYALTHQDCGLISLDLSENPIDDLGLNEISQALITNRTLEELNLSMTNVSSDGIFQLTEVLKTNPTLQNVMCPEQVSADAFCAMNRELMVNAQPKSLKDLLVRIEANENIPIIVFHDPVTAFDDPACQLLSAAIVKNTYVTELDLSGNKLTCECIPFLTEALSHCSSITSVNLANNSIGDRGGRLIISCLRENDHIISLDLRGNQITENCQSLIDELLFLNGGSIKLKKLLLKHRSGNIDEDIIDFNASRNNYQLNDNDVSILCTVLMDSTLIRAVDLGMNKITDAGCAMIADVLRCNHTMEALYLDYNPIGEIGGEALFQALKVNPQLHTLNLEGTEVPQEIWEDILSLLHVNETPLKDRIDMRNLRFEDVDDKTQFRSTDYATDQAEKVSEDAMRIFGVPTTALLLKS